MDVTVIIPVYNSKDYLHKCLDSLLSETIPNMEIIAINDGSLDNSLEILHEYDDKFTNYVIIDKENGGQALARNEALKIARGKYVFFLDSDDYMVPGALSQLFVQANENDADIVIGDMYAVYDTNDNRDLKRIEIEIDDVHKKYIMNQSGPCGFLIKKDIILNNSLFFLERHIYEDIAIVPSYALYADKIIYTNIDSYNYLQREGSTMNQVVYSKKMEDIFDSMKTLYNRFKSENKLELYHDEIEYLFIEHLLHAASLRFFNFDNYKENINVIVSMMKEYFPKYKKNPYYKKMNLKYRLVCNAFYNKNYTFLRFVLKK